MSALESTLRGKPFAEKNVYKTFQESVHGWAGARGDVSNSDARVDEGGKGGCFDSYAFLLRFSWKLRKAGRISKRLMRS